MNLAMMSFAVVPGLMVGVVGPALGVVAAFALSAVLYGFTALAIAALRRPDRPTPGALATPIASAPRAEWEMTPTISVMLRGACEQPRSR